MRYSKLTEKQKQDLITAYKDAASRATDTSHAVAIAASQVLGHNGTARGSDIQADRYSAALTYLIWAGYVRLENDPRVPPGDIPNPNTQFDFVALGDGDRSVGIPGFQVSVRVQVNDVHFFADNPEYKRDFEESMRDALKPFFLDGRNDRVLTDAEFRAELKAEIEAEKQLEAIETERENQKHE